LRTALRPPQPPNENYSERAIDQDILSGDAAGLNRTQECACCAEFIGVPEPFGRIGGSDLLGYLVDIA
jgi:hypothetical protein